MLTNVGATFATRVRALVGSAARPSEADLLALAGGRELAGGVLPGMAPLSTSLCLNLLVLARVPRRLLEHLGALKELLLLEGPLGLVVPRALVPLAVVVHLVHELLLGHVRL